MRKMKTYACLTAAGGATLLGAFAVTGGHGEAAAQVTPAAGPPAAGPPATSPTTLPATAPATRPATLPATGPAPISLDFRNAPLDAVLEHLSEAAGFVVVKDGAVDGRVTVVSRQPVSPDEAVTLLNAVLKSNGYAAVRNGRVLRVAPRDAAKKQNVPVHFGADPTAIDATDELITQVVPIGNVDAVKLRADLAPVLGTEADVAANGGSNAIVITDTSANVRRVVQIVAALDRHEPGNAELRRYTLKHADAAAAVRLITTLLKPDAPTGRPQDGGKTPPEQALRGRVTAVADDRTNTLFVSAQAATLAVVDGIVKDLEANPAAAAEIKIFTLKFAEAASAAKLIAGVFRPDDAPQSRRDGEGRPQNPADQALKARVVAQADDRTNTLVVTAPAATMKIIEEVLTRLDADQSSTSEIKVFPLSYADAASAARLVQTVFRPPEAQPNPYEQQRRAMAGIADAPLTARVNAVADDRTNSLVVTAPSETLKVIEKILQVLDANPAATAAVKSFPLKHADASSAVYLLNTLFTTDPARAGVVPGPPPAPGLTAAPARGRLTAASDSRTNTVIVQAPADLMTAAEAVLKDLDSNPTTEETLFIYRLRNGQAARMEQVLNVLFGNAQPGYGGANQLARLGLGDAAGGSARQRLAAGRTSGRTTRGGTLGLGSDVGDPRLGGLDPRLNVRGLGNNQNQQLSAGASRAVTELTGQVFVVADEDTNALLVTTGTKYLDQVKQVIAELDRPVPQVLIKVLVAEVTHDDGVDVGVDFSILNRRPNGDGQTIGTNFGLTGPNAPTGGLVVQVLESQVNATLRALATRGKLEVLSRPYILASDNQLASITVGNEVPFITNSRITDNGQQINTVEYQDVGIILNVTPHINPDGLVIMDVTPEISQLTSSTVAVSEGVTAPVIAKRSAASRVGIKTGNTIVIGGLMEDRKTSSVSKVPLLGDIPWVGALFSRTQMTKTKTELLIFLTPHVASRPDDLAPMTNDEAGGTQVVPGAVQPGMFDRHMEGLQRGAVPLTQPARPPATPPAGVDLPIRPVFRTPEAATRPAAP